MRALTVTLLTLALLAGSLLCLGPAPAAPYVSCRDGHIAPTLAECPPEEQPRPPAVTVGRGAGRSGLLGLGIGGIL
jgi:hypothetical protein